MATSVFLHSSSRANVAYFRWAFLSRWRLDRCGPSAAAAAAAALRRQRTTRFVSPLLPPATSTATAAESDDLTNLNNFLPKQLTPEFRHSYFSPGERGALAERSFRRGMWQHPSSSLPRSFLARARMCLRAGSCADLSNPKINVFPSS